MHVMDLLLWLNAAGSGEEIFSETAAVLDLATLQLDPACGWARVETIDGPVVAQSSSDLGARWGWTTAEVETLLERLADEGRLIRSTVPNGPPAMRVVLGSSGVDAPSDLFPSTLPPQRGFMGRVIQLDARALEVLRLDYPHLRDIRAELATLDAYYAEALDEAQRHRWRFRFRQALNKRNHACAVNGGAAATGHPFGRTYRPLGSGR